MSRGPGTRRHAAPRLLPGDRGPLARVRAQFDDTEFSKAVEYALATRPSIESLSEELEGAGFEDVDVEIRQTALPFDSGRAFVEDPVTRLQIVPELHTWLGEHDLKKPLDYVRDAIDKYWSEAKLELAVNIGCASARVPG